MANPSNSSTLVVQELLDDGAQGRSVELRGSGLPFRPASWKASQRVVTTWYPGNPEGAQQVLGPQEMPSEWEGMWRRTLLGRTPAMLVDGGSSQPIVFPSTLRELFDDIRIRGRRLRVVWSSTDGAGTQIAPIVREGRLAEFESPVDRQDDIAWRMRFDWAGRGGAQQRVVATRGGGLASAVTGVQAASDAATAAAVQAQLVARKASVPLGPTRFSLGQLEQLVDAPNKLLTGYTRSLTQLTSQLNQVAGIALKARALPAQLANTAIAFARNSVALANQFHDALARRPAELNALSTQLADLTRSTTYFWQATDAAHQVAAASARLRKSVTSSSLRAGTQSTTTTLKVHVVKQGETLSSIAVFYYGNPDEAWQIARANRLPWTTTNKFPRRTLIIPVLSSSDGT